MKWRVTREDADVTMDLSGVSQCKLREAGRGYLGNFQVIDSLD